MNELALKGARPSRPTTFTPIYTARLYNGLVTQRNPFIDNGSHIESEFYGKRIDCLIDGLNTEVSPKLTYVRRPGTTIFNSTDFDGVNRFYENRYVVYDSTQTMATEGIQVVADATNFSTGFIYDVTPSAPERILFTKSTGVNGYFQSVGNSLYFSDGPERIKVLTPSKVWAANTVFSVGDFIEDTNGNIQVATSAFTLDISTVAVREVSGTWYAIVTFEDPIAWTVGTGITFSGLTSYTALNGLTRTTLTVAGITLNPNQVVVAAPTSITYGVAEDSGSATSQAGATQYKSGITAPTWSNTVGGYTSDGNLQWRMFDGAASTDYSAFAFNWGLDTPGSAPVITPNPSNRQWLPNETLSLFYTILDSNNSIQAVTSWQGSAPVTGPTPPTWGTDVPNNTGTSSSVTVDGTIGWNNCGQPGSWLPSTQFGDYQCIVDSNGNIQIVHGMNFGMSGSTPPTWATSIGSTTNDGTLVWTCGGSGNILLSGAVQYAFSTHSIDGSVSTASPIGTQNLSGGVLGASTNYFCDVSGTIPADTQTDEIWIWKTTQGGSTLLFLDSIPAPSYNGGSQSFTYRDYSPQQFLNIEIQAPIADTNNPPPKGMTANAYHLSRVWGFVGNLLYYSTGPDVTAGNGNTAWNPSNVFVLPSSGVRLWPNSYGLVVFTTSDIYIVQGLGTASSPFYISPFLQGIGLGSYDGFTVNGGVAYLYTTDNQVITFDPSSGISEVGFPIGDQFGPDYGTTTFTPSSTKLTWHVAGSPDKGLYVSDSQGSWWKMIPTPSPETGVSWSPRAAITGGFTCVQSVETSPGVHQLLIASSSSGRQILKRDSSVYTDGVSIPATAYNSFFILGSIVLAQPGQRAIVSFITTDAMAVGTEPTLAIQLDEIAPVSAGYFEDLTQYVPDPTELNASNSVYAQRFYLSQTQQPAWCRHLQVQVNFGTDTVKNELLSMTLFGGFEQEN